jgi:hypothetical protein
LQQQVHVGVVVAAQRLAVDIDRAGGLAAEGLARGFELRRFVGEFAIAHAKALVKVGAFLFEVEDAATELGFALFELADLLQLALALVLDGADFVALAIDVAELLAEAAAQRLDVHFKAAGGKGEFGAELVFVGAELGHGDRRRCFDALFGEAHGTAPDGWHDGEREEARYQEPQRQIHNVLNAHEEAPTLARS